MRHLFRHRDLMRLGQGAALAGVAGLLLGAAMQPKLDGDGLIAPQIELPSSGVRAQLAAYDPGVAAYGANPPEYVVGTDHTRPTVVEDVVLAYDERAASEPDGYDTPIVVYEAGAAAHDVVERDAWRDEPIPAPHYPSQLGNTFYESDLPEAPPAPEAEWDPAAA